ncbi:hypothetical protein SAMN06265346_12610 [Flavobacterium hercynium]|nr:hypothetical protein SAMN06265346_12610 [Flavobacterium hercynium]
MILDKLDLVELNAQEIEGGFIPLILVSCT